MLPRQGGLENSFSAAEVLQLAVDGLLARGHTAEAAALIDLQAMGPIDRDNWPLHMCGMEIALLRGETDAIPQHLLPLDVGADLEHALAVCATCRGGRGVGRAARPFRSTRAAVNGLLTA
jgi:hypothetical protein